MEHQDRLLFAEEVAALAGVSARTIIQYNQAARRGAGGAQSNPGLPAPADWVDRKVPAGAHEVTVSSPRWRESEILAWLPTRRRPGGQARPAAPGV